jgi:16S rRNA (guanine527-N7)-methyltransferase
LSDSPVPSFVREDLQKLEVTVTDDALALLAKYLDLLLLTNEKFNLTAIRDLDEAWRRHIIDSLTLLPFIEHLPAGAGVIDVGSGGGLPGIPLAIARPDLRVTLLESTGKKAAFLSECVRTLPLPNAVAVNDRAEKAGHDRRHREKYDAVVCRAVGVMTEILECSLPLVTVGGVLLAMKGPKAQQELEDAGDAMSILGAGEFAVVDAYPESFGLNTVIVSVVKADPTPDEYPRAPGLPRTSPLGANDRD